MSDSNKIPAQDPVTETEDSKTESGVRKVNLRDMPPSQDDEVGGPRGPEPTRYGDWERKGRVSDF
jgi:hypothetical protein